MTPLEVDKIIDTVRAVFPAAFHNADPDTVLDAYSLTIEDLDYADCRTQVGILARTGAGPFITPGKDIRVPLLRRLGVLAPTALEAWEAVARYVRDARAEQLMVQDLDPLIRAAYESATFQAQVEEGYDGLRLLDKVWSRKVFEEVYSHVAAQHDLSVMALNTTAAISAAKSAGPRVLLATDWREKEAELAASEATRKQAIKGDTAA